MKHIVRISCTLAALTLAPAALADDSAAAHAWLDGAVAGTLAPLTPSKDQPLVYVIESGPKACKGIQYGTVTEAKKLAKLRKCIKASVDSLQREVKLPPTEWSVSSAEQLGKVMDREEPGLIKATAGASVFEAKFDTDFGETRWFYVAVRDGVVTGVWSWWQQLE